MGASKSGQCKYPGKKGGAQPGPNPTDRGKPGTKRHVVVERKGIPLTAMITGVNTHDSAVFEELIDGIKVRIARKGMESKEKLGRHRWVVERSPAWLSKYRRLAVRYERHDDIHLAFLPRRCALICLNYLK